MRAIVLIDFSRSVAAIRKRFHAIFMKSPARMHA
jgi:hypothetical protein